MPDTFTLQQGETKTAIPATSGGQKKITVARTDHSDAKLYYSKHPEGSPEGMLGRGESLTISERYWVWGFCSAAGESGNAISVLVVEV